MTREQVYADMRKTLGLVPTFFTTIPDGTLELEWETFQRVQFEAGPIPNKYRELIGLAIAAVIKCKYCLFYHTEVAKLAGATPAEIEDAVHFAKSSVGWSTYLTGMSTDYERFQRELLQVCDHLRKNK